MLTSDVYILKYFIFNLNAFLLYAVIKDRCAPEILEKTTIHGHLGAFFVLRGAQMLGLVENSDYGRCHFLPGF